MPGTEWRATRGRARSVVICSGPGEFLARVEQSFGVERLLDRLVHVDCPRRPLEGELAVLHQPDAVLAGDRALELDGEREQLVRRLLRALELGRLIEVDHERRVE